MTSATLDLAARRYYESSTLNLGPWHKLPDARRDAFAKTVETLAARLAPRGPWTFRDLSPRMLEVVDLIAQPMTNRAAAARMGVALRTVETYLVHAYDQSGFTSRADLIAAYRQWCAARERAAA